MADADFLNPWDILKAKKGQFFNKMELTYLYNVLPDEELKKFIKEYDEKVEEANRDLAALTSFISTNALKFLPVESRVIDLLQRSRIRDHRAIYVPKFEESLPWRMGCDTAFMTEAPFRVVFFLELYESLNNFGKIFVISHETGHYYRKHLTRKLNRDSQLWNLVDDLIINYDLLTRKLPSLFNEMQRTKVKQFDQVTLPDLIKPGYEHLMETFNFVGNIYPPEHSVGTFFDTSEWFQKYCRDMDYTEEQMYDILYKPYQDELIKRLEQQKQQQQQPPQPSPPQQGSGQSGQSDSPQQNSDDSENSQPQNGDPSQQNSENGQPQNGDPSQQSSENGQPQNGDPSQQNSNDSAQKGSPSKHNGQGKPSQNNGQGELFDDEGNPTPNSDNSFNDRLDELDKQLKDLEDQIANGQADTPEAQKEQVEDPLNEGNDLQKVKEQVEHNTKFPNQNDLPEIDGKDHAQSGYEMHKRISNDVASSEMDKTFGKHADRMRKVYEQAANDYGLPKSESEEQQMQDVARDEMERIRDNISKSQNGQGNGTGDLEGAIQRDKDVQSKLNFRFMLESAIKRKAENGKIERTDRPNALARMSKLPDMRKNMNIKTQFHFKEKERQNDAINVMLQLDSSGSVRQEEYQYYFAEIADLVIKNNVTIHTFWADTQVKNKGIIIDKSNIDEIVEKGLPFAGGGGTDMCAPLAYQLVMSDGMEEKGFDLAMVLTDGEFSMFTYQNLMDDMRECAANVDSLASDEKKAKDIKKRLKSMKRGDNFETPPIVMINTRERWYCENEFNTFPKGMIQEYILDSTKQDVAVQLKRRRGVVNSPKRNGLRKAR